MLYNTYLQWKERERQEVVNLICDRQHLEKQFYTTLNRITKSQPGHEGVNHMFWCVDLGQ